MGQSYAATSVFRLRSQLARSAAMNLLRRVRVSIVNGTIRGTICLTGMVLVAGTLTGCLNTEKTLHYFGESELKHYKDVATSVDYPNIEETLPDEISFSETPRTLLDQQNAEIWDLPLAQALLTAMENNRVIQTGTQPGIGAKSVLTNPQSVTSVYDPAIQESGVLFGGRGLESALAAFDAQFTTSMVWGRNEQLQNNFFFGGGLAPGSTLISETGNFASQISKQFGHGGRLRLDHNWDYRGNNVLGQLFPTSYSGLVSANYRHPLWAGRGTEFTRIAGPIGLSFGGLSGVTQGVVISRINNDITLADFETGVRNGLKDVEDAYWILYLQYRLWDTAVTARNSALYSWRQANDILKAGGKEGFKPADESQALDNYFRTRADTEAARNQVYAAELNLRRLLGLPINDGRIIRPADEPTTSQFIPSWHVSLAEALARRVELRKQKWRIKSLELQLKASRSLTKPRFDFVSSYRVNAFGDSLFGQNDSDGMTAQGLESAYETLTQGDQTGWGLGFELTMPIGFRSAHAQVRNIELRLAKARDVLAQQEREVSHDLAIAFQDLAVQYKTAETNFNRLRAARRRLELFNAEFEVGTVTLDLVLRAQASLADAERSYYSSLVQYNRAIASYFFAAGKLLEHNNVHLAEGEWSPVAYRDALRQAWARSYALDNKRLHTEPQEFVLPGYSGHVDYQTEGEAPVGEDQPARYNRKLEMDSGIVPVPPAPNRDDEVPGGPPQTTSPKSTKANSVGGSGHSINDSGVWLVPTIEPVADFEEAQ